MFCTNLQSPVWIRHIGALLWCTNMAAGKYCKHLELTLGIYATDYLYWTNIHLHKHISCYFHFSNGKKSPDKCIFFDKHDRNCMPCTAITLKFKVRWFPTEGGYWAEQLQADTILVPLMPDVNRNFGVSLVLDFSTWWRHVKTIYTLIGRRCLVLSQRFFSVLQMRLRQWGPINMRTKE